MFELALEAVIEFEQISGTQNETIIKELFIAGKNVLEKFCYVRWEGAKGIYVQNKKSTK